MRKTSYLAGTILCSALAAMALPSVAHAQDAQTAPAVKAADEDPAAEEDGEAIVVTGSLFRRTNSETPSPVTVLSAATLEQRGINTVAEAVQRVSANGAGTITQGWNNTSNFATGANAVSLRGLTVQSTLSIFDGLRMAPYPLADDGQRNFVDLNTIPDSIVERIEILRDGASSTYGADAIAGVVNVITKKEIKGIHLNASAGISTRGDLGEQRADAAFGYGDLSEQGFNFYVAGEYQHSDRLFARDRDYPINTSDLSKICQSGSTTICQANAVQFGINADGTLGAGTTTPAVLIAPSTLAGGRTGEYRLLNAAGGCDLYGLNPVTLTNAQRALNVAGTFFTWAPQQCQEDARARYQTIQPEQERYGATFRGTVNIGERAQAYATVSYYNVNTQTQTTPPAFTQALVAPSVEVFNPIVLPVYVCAAGVATINRVTGVNTSAGCTAANGTLNPNNPFAAAGGNAILRGRYDRPYQVGSNARSLRGALGIAGGFGDNWEYSADFVASNVKLDIEQRNMLVPQRLADVIATGAYNFVNQSLNTQAVRDYVAPLNSTTSNSELWQFNATLGKTLFQLPGGGLQAAVGVAYRHESIDNPSANPDNQAHPYDRYYTINAVGAVGSRNVKSAYFEINAPILSQLEVNLSGRYDDYSSGQSNFSPKVGVKFTPIQQLAIRGTYSKGFRIPSFNEAFGLPTTGFIANTVDCTVYTVFCAAHSPNGTANTANAYAAAPGALGITAVGNPALSPEKSRSFTAGAIFEPVRGISFTVDYWNVKINDLITGISGDDQQAAIDQYYRNNGVVTIPGVIALPAAADPQFPAALPGLGSLQSSYRNADSQQVQGIDLGANADVNLFGIKLYSSFEASYLLRYEFTSHGSTVRYDGTLSPCNVTSCSGAPKWRGSWQNTLDFGDVSISGTAYYTSPVTLNAVDNGETGCAFLSGGGIKAFKGTTIPVQCRSKPIWNFDMTASVDVSERFKLYVNVLNVFDIKAPYDPSAAYGIARYNPAWAQPNAIGRYFRAGAKVNF